MLCFVKVLHVYFSNQLANIVVRNRSEVKNYFWHKFLSLSWNYYVAETI